MARIRTVQGPAKAILPIMVAAALATALMIARPTPALAAPALVPGIQVGAQPPHQAITNLPAATMPPAHQVPGQCAFESDPLNPPAVPIKHIAPCGNPMTGTGAPDKPWGTIAQAVASLAPGDVAYVHDDPARAVDYSEYNLTPARGGTGAPCPSGGMSPPLRIRLMAAPGEGQPTVAKPPNATVAAPVLRLTQPWWLVEGLRILGDRVQQHSVVFVQGSCIVLRRLEVTGAGGANAAVTFNDAENVALLESHISEQLVGDAVTGRPQKVPTDAKDHHGVTVSGASNKVLLRDNHSYGHNGDSIQCGEALNTTPSPDPTNLTIEGNRYHQDEENAVDLKHCVGVTIRGNKLFGYHPARPHATKRSPHGDAVVVHVNALNQPAERILIESNRFFRNSRSVNLDPRASSAVVRRNLVFDARNDNCGLGAGIRAAAQTIEVYHNTLDRLPGPLPTKPSECADMDPDPNWWWSPSEGAAVRITIPAGAAQPVLWNNIIAHAGNHLAAPVNALDAKTNLFDVQPAGGTPSGSLIGDPMFINDPANNDYYTNPGSPARDAATVVPQVVRDPAVYCDDPSEPDTLVEPDIGFLESCF